MPLATVEELRTAALSVRTDLVPRFAEFLALAEQRMYYGGDGVPPLRIRQMEVTAPLALVDGAETLPEGFLDKRALYWQGAATVAVAYEPPGVFYPMSSVRVGGSYPEAYTVEGDTLKVSPALSGTAQLLYYERAAALAGDSDTNVILLTFPGVYLYGIQIEVFRATRDVNEQANALRRYADAVDAANRYTLVSRTQGGALRRKVGFAV